MQTSLLFIVGELVDMTVDTNADVTVDMTLDITIYITVDMTVNITVDMTVDMTKKHDSRSVWPGRRALNKSTPAGSNPVFLIQKILN